MSEEWRDLPTTWRDRPLRRPGPPRSVGVMSWSIDDIPRQDGRVAVVTGANGGLGLITAIALAGRGAHVVMAARDQAKAATARDRLLATHASASAEIVALDLGDLSSVEHAAETILAAHPAVDLLIN